MHMIWSRSVLTESQGGERLRAMSHLKRILTRLVLPTLAVGALTLVTALPAMASHDMKSLTDVATPSSMRHCYWCNSGQCTVSCYGPNGRTGYSACANGTPFCTVWPPTCWVPPCVP